VKVVQRVPVKIVLDAPEPPDRPLRLGLSVEVAIDTSDRRGPLLSSTLQRKYQRGGQPIAPESLNLQDQTHHGPQHPRRPPLGNLLPPLPHG
jgi:hypothetical protein